VVSHIVVNRVFWYWFLNLNLLVLLIEIATEYSIMLLYALFCGSHYIHIFFYVNGVLGFVYRAMCIAHFCDFFWKQHLKFLKYWKEINLWNDVFYQRVTFQLEILCILGFAKLTKWGYQVLPPIGNKYRWFYTNLVQSLY
jgi:hypothetical protein